MTAVYFVRHAQSDYSVLDDNNRPLTAKGMSDRGLATDFLSDKRVDAVLSSPFKRAFDTLSPFAEANGFSIEIIEESICGGKRLFHRDHRRFSRAQGRRRLVGRFPRILRETVGRFLL